jgi:hypothetical protein
VNLYKLTIRTKKKQRELELVVHAPSLDDAKAHVRQRYLDCEFLDARELDYVTKHFVIAELDQVADAV